MTPTVSKYLNPPPPRPLIPMDTRARLIAGIRSNTLDGATERREKSNKAGLFVTRELDKAIAECSEKVRRLAKECRAGNRKFRDIEFDLIEDRDRCLYGLNRTRNYDPLEARRVNQIFEAPEFTINEATPGDIAQGDLGDCWFLSALAVVAGKGLIPKICVEKDEKVGIYGFIFWRDSCWVEVIIDDLLFTKVPKWESLTLREQMLYHHSRDQYNRLSRKGSKTLYFARSQTEDETWVPLIEKAYAKLHGDYASLESGFTSEAVEDLTGASSTLIYTQDILDVDEFWENELMHANEDRLFACFIPQPPLNALPDDGIMYPTNGLIVGHAYSIIKATTYRNKRFLRIRNPWGRSEWTGPWSDGSKEWNGFDEALKKLDYSFDQDGEFVMEYRDFLETWEIIEKCRLFDNTWILSSRWLQVNAGEFPREWNYGDVSFTITISKPTLAVIVLAQLDTRFFRGLESTYRWSLDFQIYEQGELLPLASSIHSSLWDRSVKAEVDLKAKGVYIVHVRLDRKLVDKNRKFLADDPDPNWDDRKLSRKKVELALSKAIAANFDSLTLPLRLDMFAGKSLAEVEKQALDAIEDRRKKERATSERHPSVSADTDPSVDPVIIIENIQISEEPQSLLLVNEDSGATDTMGPDDRRVGSRNGLPSAFSPTNSRYQTCSDMLEASPNTTGDQQRMQVRNTSSQLSDGGALDRESTAKASNQQVVPHDGFYCRRCKATIHGSLWHCIDISCTKFTLCDPCYGERIHPKHHDFLEFKTPEDSIHINEKLDALNSVVIGLKVYTQGDAAGIEGQVRHGNVIRQGLLSPAYP